MIQANELRLGNLVQHNSEWNYAGHNGVFQWSDSDWYAIGECTLQLENVSSTPLTEELLIKIGFEKSGYDRYVLNEDFYYENGSFWIGLPDGQFWRYVRISEYRTQYAHQLQNLYHALKGEELTIKETV